MRVAKVAWAEYTIALIRMTGHPLQVKHVQITLLWVFVRMEQCNLVLNILWEKATTTPKKIAARVANQGLRSWMCRTVSFRRITNQNNFQCVCRENAKTLWRSACTSVVLCARSKETQWNLPAYSIALVLVYYAVMIFPWLHQCAKMTVAGITTMVELVLIM